MKKKAKTMIKVTPDLERKFKEYLSRYFDDEDGDNYENLIASYPVLWEDFINSAIRSVCESNSLEKFNKRGRLRKICRMCRFPKTWRR